MLVQRVNWLYPGNDAGVRFYFDMKKKYPKSFDELWVTTLTGFPPLEAHASCARWFKDFSDTLKSMGVKVSLQLANCIGHGDMIGDTFDCSALADRPDVQPLVGEDGTPARYCFCPNNAAFREYSYQEVAIYAQTVQPDKFWIDDDMRPNNHLPVQYGCFCPDCLAKFGARYGVHFDREQLLQKVLGNGDGLIWRKRWIEFVRDSLKSYLRGLCEAVHAVSPETEFGLQNYCNGSYTGYGLGYLFDEMKAVNGKAPHYRAGGGFYTDHHPNFVLEKGHAIAYQHSFLPYHGVLSPEIECVPNTAFGKTVAGILLETSHYLALGADDMTYNAIDDLNDPFEWHEEKFAQFERMRPYWEKLAAVSKQTTAAGMRYVVSKSAFLKPLQPGDGIRRLSQEHALSAYELLRDGLPIVYDEAEDDVLLLHPDVAAILTDEEVEALKTKNVLTCGESAGILTARGFDLGFRANAVPEKEKGMLTEFYETDGVARTLNGDKKDRFSECYHTSGRFSPYVLEDLPQDALILGKYRHNTKPSDPIGGKIATAVIPMKEGGKWAVFGYTLWRPVKTIAERDRILNVYDFLADCAPARILSPVQASISVRKDRNGAVLAVSLTNCSIGAEEQVKVFVKKPSGINAVFWGQYEKKEPLKMEPIRNGTVVTLPHIAPWSVATVFFE